MAASKSSTKGVVRAPGRTDCVVGAGLCAAAVLALAAPGARAADWRVTPAISASETFTDNVNLAPQGRKDPALITQVTPGISIRGTGARLRIALDSSVDVRYQAITDPEKQVDVNLAGTSTAEILRELLFFDASASVSQEALNDRAAVSASGANTSNLDTVQTYQASPYLVHRLGNFANAQERYTFSRVDTGGSQISSSMTHKLDLSLSSGTDFTRLLWGLHGSATNSVESNDEDEKERRVDANLELVVDPSFSLLGSGGYETFDFGESRSDIQGATWSAGFRWRPSPATEVQARYGRRFGDEFKEASVRYDVSPRTTVTANISTTLDEPQDRSTRDLSSIAVDESGMLIDSRTGQPFDPTTSELSFSNERQRTTIYGLRLNTIQGRSRINLTGSKQTQEGLQSGQEDDVIVLGGSLGQQISPKASLNTSVTFQRSKFDADGRRDNEYTFIGLFSYQIFQNANATVSYSYRRRDSTASQGEFTENAVTVGATYRF